MHDTQESLILLVVTKLRSSLKVAISSASIFPSIRSQPDHTPTQVCPFIYGSLS